MKKYEKISPWKVFEVLVLCDIDIMNPMCGIINLVNIAELLHTSRYQVKRDIDYLVRIEVAEQDTIMIPTEDEIYPPYHGYRITKAAKHKGGDMIPDGVDVGTMLKYRAFYQRKNARWINL